MTPITVFYTLTSIILAAGIFWLATDPRTIQERMKYFFTSQKAYLFLSYLFVLVAQWGFLQKGMLQFGGGDVVTLVGLIVFVVGYSFAIWAKLAMKRIWGPPGQLDTARQNKLVTGGPFQYSRNPIYTGLLIGMVGYFVAIHSYFIFLLLIPWAYLQYKDIPKEEKLLKKYFGQEYQTYCEQVRRWL